MTAQTATAPAPATSSTACLSGSRRETVDTRKSNRPFSSTNATGRTVLISQFTRTELRRSGSGPAGATSWGSGLTARTRLLTNSVFTASGIGMHSWQEISDTEEGEHHNRKAKDGKVSSPATSPTARDTHVQISGIDHPGDRCPRLFRIPAPIRSPGTICPVSARCDHQRQERERNADGFVGDAVQIVGGG